MPNFNITITVSCESLEDAEEISAKLRDDVTDLLDLETEDLVAVVVQPE